MWQLEQGEMLVAVLIFTFSIRRLQMSGFVFGDILPAQLGGNSYTLSLIGSSAEISSQHVLDVRNAR